MCFVRALALLIVAGVAINIGVDYGTANANPGLGFIWGVVCFIFWSVIALLVIRFFEWLKDNTSGHDYFPPV